MAQQRRIKLELDEAALAKLLGGKRLCVSDFHCLDQRSKERVRRIYLSKCKIR